MEFIAIFIYLGLSYLVADKIGKAKKIGFTKSFIVCVLASPFIGYLIAEGSALANPRGCKWCNNLENEAEYCGICKKNEAGDLREHRKK